MRKIYIFAMVTVTMLSLMEAKGSNVLDYLNSSTLAMASEPLPGTPSVPAIAPTGACNTYTITASTPGGETYYWQTSATGFDQTISLATPLTLKATQQIYYIRAYSQTYDTWSTDTRSVPLTINSPPTISVTATPATICIGAASQLAATGASTSYSWSSSLPATATNSVTPIVTTTYTVTGTNSNTGCSNSANVTVNVHSNPIQSLTATPIGICVGGSSQLATTGTSVSYVWNHSLPTTATNRVSPVLTTNYTVTGTDALGCTGSKSIDVVVNVVDQPILATGSTGTTDVNVLMCNGNTQSIHVTNPGTNSVKWYNGLNAVIATDVPTYTFIITKDTTIKTQYQDPTSKCFSEFTSVPIKMVKADFTMSGTSVKQGGTLTMTNASKNATSYNWTMSGGLNDNQQFTTTNATFNFNNLGIKKILLTAISASCQDTTSKKVSVVVLGITDLKEDGIMIYPNPFSNLLNVDLTDINKDIVLTVYNLAGVKVIDKEIKKANSVETIDMSKLPVGTYLMVLTTAKGTLTAKLKKE